jgi:hypothetical protein
LLTPVAKLLDYNTPNEIIAIYANYGKIISLEEIAVIKKSVQP